MVFDKFKDVIVGSDRSDNLGNSPIGGYEKYLEGVSYPLGLDDAISVLKNNGAPSQLVGIAEGLAEGGVSSFSSQEELVNSIRNFSFSNKYTDPPTRTGPYIEPDDDERPLDQDGQGKFEN